MRHQPMLKSFTFTEAAGDLFGNGAIVVLGPEAVAAGRRAALRRGRPGRAAPPGAG